MLNTAIKRETWDSHQAGGWGATGCLQLGKAGTGASSKHQVEISAEGNSHRDRSLGIHNHLGQQCPGEGTARQQHWWDFLPNLPILGANSQTGMKANIRQMMQREGLRVWNNHTGTNLCLIPVSWSTTGCPLLCLARDDVTTHRIKLLVHWGDPKVLENWLNFFHPLSPAPATCLCDLRTGDNFRQDLINHS